MAIIELDKFPRASVIKASGAIAIEGKYTLVERRIYNLLLAAAYDAMEERETHTISVDALMDGLGGKIDSHYDEIRSALNSLMQIIVQYNILQKDKRIWTATTLLAGYNINEATRELFFSFSPQLRTLLVGKPYAKLSVEKQNRIGSKHSLIMYELLIDYFDQRRRLSKTPLLEIATLQVLFGSQNYDTRDFCRYVIDKSLSQISADLDFTVETFYKKRGRSRTHVQFTMTRKNAPKRAKKENQSQVLPAEEKRNHKLANAKYDEIFEALPETERTEILSAATAALPKFVLQYEPESPAYQVTLKAQRDKILFERGL